MEEKFDALQDILNTMEMLGGEHCSIRIEYFGPFRRLESNPHRPQEGTTRVSHELSKESVAELYDTLKRLKGLNPYGY